MGISENHTVTCHQKNHQKVVAANHIMVQTPKEILIRVTEITDIPIITQTEAVREREAHIIGMVTPHFIVQTEAMEAMEVDQMAHTHGTRTAPDTEAINNTLKLTDVYLNC